MKHWFNGKYSSQICLMPQPEDLKSLIFALFLWCFHGWKICSFTQNVVTSAKMRLNIGNGCKWCKETSFCLFSTKKSQEIILVCIFCYTFAQNGVLFLPCFSDFGKIYGRNIHHWIMAKIPKSGVKRMRYICQNPWMLSKIWFDIQSLR